VLRYADTDELAAIEGNAPLSVREGAATLQREVERPFTTRRLSLATPDVPVKRGEPVTLRWEPAAVPITGGREVLLRDGVGASFTLTAASIEVSQLSFAVPADAATGPATVRVALNAVVSRCEGVARCTGSSPPNPSLALVIAP